MYNRSDVTHNLAAVDQPAEPGTVILGEDPQPDLEVRTILSVINAVNRRRQLKSYSLESARTELRMAAGLAGTCEKVWKVTSKLIDGPNGSIPIRIYIPESAKAPYPMLVWFHGGGFILGDLDVADGTCRAIANQSRAAVVSVDYRLAPEHGLDAGREDCIAATRWVRDHGSELGLDSSRVAVGGDSAGGNLAAVVAQHCARDGVKLALQVLVYPATDLRTDYKDHPCAEGFMLTYEVMNWIKSHIPDDLGRSDPWLSPALAKDLHGVAPALVITAGCDPLREDGLGYVKRLRGDGVAVKSLHYPGQFHGFLTFDLLLHGGRDAIARIGAALADAFKEHEPASTRRRQLNASRRQLIELQFNQLVIARFLLDLNRAVRRALVGPLGLAIFGRPDPIDPIDLSASRFKRVVENIG